MRLTPQIRSTPTAQWQVAGYLYDSVGSRGIGQDMFQAWLSDGTLIDAGWIMENGTGMYRICVTRDFSELREPFFTADIHRAAAKIEEIAAELFPQQIPATIVVRIFLGSNEANFDTVVSTSASNSVDLVPA